MALIPGRRRACTLHFDWRGSQLRLWLHVGGLALWLDTQMGRFEINGRSLAITAFGARRALRCLDGIPLQVMEPDGLNPQQRAGYAQLAAYLGKRRYASALNGVRDALPRRGLGRILGGLLVLGLVLAAGSPEPEPSPGLILLSAALAGAALLAGRLRGGSALVWAAAGTGLALLARPAWVVLPGPLLAGLGLVLVLVWLCGWIGVLGPWPWVLALLAHASPEPGLAGQLRLPLALLLGAGASLASFAPRRLELGTRGEDVWRFEVLSQALAEVDNHQLWALHPLLRDQVPPMAAAITCLDLRLDRGQRPWRVITAEGQWFFFPQALLEVRAGLGARLMPLAQVRLEGRPCLWEGAPPGMGSDQFLVRLQGPGPEALQLLFGHRWQGQRFLKKLAPFCRLAEESEPEPPAPGVSAGPEDDAQALALLGLEPGAGTPEIKRAYHRLAQRFHPDAYPGLSAAERARLEARMAELNLAYERLRNGRRAAGRG